MKRIPWRDHVVATAGLHHGEPCIKGTRISVRTLIGSLADGMTPQDLLAVYPQLSLKDVFGALSYAADVPAAEIRPLKPAMTKGRPVGLAKGLFEVPPDFFEPLPEDLLDAFEGK